MPYIPKRQDFTKMARTIKGYASMSEVAKALECSAPTARRKIAHPDELSLGNLKRLSQRLHIPIEELREAITW